MKTACSQCGGTIEIGPLERFVLCGFCQSALLIVGRKTYRPLLVLPLLHARAAAQRIGECGEGLIVSAGDLQLVYVPYWVDGARIRLATPTLGAVADLAAGRPQPAGQIMYRQDAADEQLAEAIFLDPESEGRKEQSGGEPAGESQIVYIPHYRLLDEEAGVGPLFVDGLEGTVCGLPDREVVSAQARIDLIWCAAIFLAPLLVTIWGGPWWLVMAGGLAPAGLYLLFR
jgi:hypothetical protein